MYSNIYKYLWNLLVKFQLDPTVGFEIMLNSVKLNGRNFYAKIRIWPCLVRITRLNRIIWCLCMWVAWPRDHEVRIIWYQSLDPLIRLYLSKIFVSCFCKNSLVSNVFFSLILQHIKNKIKNIISFYYCPKYISSIKKRKKKVIQKDVYWFLPQKTKQGKIGSNQLRISSKFILWLPGSYSHNIYYLGLIGYRLLWFSIPGLIRSHS
jgi:hypothetical protein